MAVRVWRTITSTIPIPGLADTGYHVVCYDQLGCGESDKPDALNRSILGFNPAPFVAL